jgi:hypothetical protein
MDAGWGAAISDRQYDHAPVLDRLQGFHHALR